MKIQLEQTDSTNRVAKERAAEGAEEQTVIWALQQQSGQGQYGRVFASPLGGLYFSLILRPQLPFEALPLITLATGLACRDVLSEVCSVHAQIKWPNDLYVDGKKVGGILCENSIDARQGECTATVIIGVGLNINSQVTDFPRELHSIVTTVLDATGRKVELEALLEQLIKKIGTFVDELAINRDSLLDRWQNYDYLLNRSLRYINGEQIILGTGRGLAPDGRYRIVDASGAPHAIIGGQLRPVDQ
ncbi:biotin--[acetyl-CoA-carboxylase] ligase [Desulfobulbus rhabdoformis]|jgi:BirA family biotin operon repressor/biotin-[acetyl-CoA-carboxylase] ligase|uniref:biotin--[acetyl-CoA-carboxylase] ligase n=1 Tax=Desulfobulbus rhabdoformis TaxID=34032 RepID=UPI0019633999|nr:biotin--[acetyl-CoA-carboxylase] ligase [Desulfobulbus rhabdoformis]MBM9614273.1 biotin--[acetyl-CoA-carboxylase] ligase [Desulfobulbus rhabdoformis]